MACKSFGAKRLHRRGSASKTLAFDGAYPAFRERIQVRAAGWQAERLNAGRSKRVLKGSAELCYRDHAEQNGSEAARCQSHSLCGEPSAPSILRVTSRHFLAWCLERNIAPNYIQPGKPVQNSHIETFNGKFSG